MAEPAPATENNEARRVQMLRAAAELVCERGFSETRISDVAKRAGVSSALVIYYFGTRDRLLVDALRYSEESFYEAAEQMLAEIPSLRERLSLLIQWTCVPAAENEIPGAWGLWFDLWAQAFRHDEVKAGRVELDARWRRMIVDAVESAELDSEVDATDVRPGVLRTARRLVDPGGTGGSRGRLEGGLRHRDAIRRTRTQPARRRARPAQRRRRRSR